MIEDPVVIAEFFRQLHKMCQEHYLQTSDCSNFDQTGFRIGVSSSDHVIMMDFERPVCKECSDNQESLTVIEQSQLLATRYLPSPSLLASIL